MTADSRCSIVMPAYREGHAIEPVLARLAEAVTLPFEALVVVDDADDPTVGVVTEVAGADSRFRVVVNEYGRGPGNAIRYGIDRAAAAVIVVTMADGSDDPRQIDDLVRLVERGVVVACASRYMSGGQQVGGPALKSFLSRAAGRSLHLLARVGTRDATNSFKAYSTEFVRTVGIEVRRVRAGDRADGEGPEAEASGRRDPDDLARAGAGNVELQDGCLDSALPALVPLRVRSTPERRPSSGRRTVADNQENPA